MTAPNHYAVLETSETATQLAAIMIQQKMMQQAQMVAMSAALNVIMENAYKANYNLRNSVTQEHAAPRMRVR